MSMQSVKNRTRSHLLHHCKPCLCETISLASIMKLSDGTIAQQVAEVYFIEKRKGKRVY